MLKIAEQPTVLENAASHVLRATVTPDRPVRVRKDWRLAQAGEIDLWHEDAEADAEIAAATKPTGWRVALSGAQDVSIVKAVSKRLQPDVGIKGLTAGNLRLHRASGEGEILLGRNGGDVTVFSLEAGSATFFRQDEILAHTDSITAASEKVVGEALMLVLERAHAWVLSGSGEVATASSGEVVVIEVRPDRPVVVEVEALLAMAGDVVFDKPDDYGGRVAMRGVSTVAKYLPESVDLGRTKVWLIARGTGQLVVRSSD